MDGVRSSNVAPKASWRGYLKVAEVSCGIGLYAAASRSDRVAFHTLNRQTGHRVRRQFVDSETRKPVSEDDQVRGYEVASGEFIALEPQEIAAALPHSDKVLTVSHFIDHSDIDEIYFDKPYFLTPTDRQSQDAYFVLCEGMKREKVAAVATTALFRRLRSFLVRPFDAGFIAQSLSFDYEVRSVDQAFDTIPEIKTKRDMIELAEHIIETKKGRFDPAGFEDRYEDALSDLIKAKLEGRRIVPPKQPRVNKVIDLMAVLRKSAALEGKTRTKSSGSRSVGRKRKAG
jgi:DNA end-binding protein Ku